ncbi:ABC transporter, periplasmic spermidine putrescine-binding protein PotD (TC 3.A.1.11.1) [Olavius sp. associated proteobacterium Delta 1]|nr:ABC transporter, periplasmic spermidine putrescine-binding protein PotD (TC 3.A.1.11.1) [Olavius sp. associated proteobacterium Delta 1]
MALIYLGFDQCNENPAEMKKVQELLLRQKPHVKVYNSDGILERLVSREVAVHHNWNGYAMRARMQYPALKYAFPVEGVLSWVDNLVVPTGAKNYANAIKFIEFMLQPENAAMQSNNNRYANGIKGSEAFMDKDLKTAPELNVPEGYKTVFLETCSEKAIRLYGKVWTRLKQ